MDINRKTLLVEQAEETVAHARASLDRAIEGGHRAAITRAERLLAVADTELREASAWQCAHHEAMRAHQAACQKTA